MQTIYKILINYLRVYTNINYLYTPSNEIFTTRKLGIMLCICSDAVHIIHIKIWCSL